MKNGGLPADEATVLGWKETQSNVTKVGLGTLRTERQGNTLQHIG